jgi:hypothetical protein
MNTKTFHFDFSRFEIHRTGRMAKEPLFLKIQSSKLPLSAHTVETRRKAKGSSKAVDTLLTAGRDENLTHFVEVPEDLLPDDRIALMLVTGPDRGKPRQNLPDLYSVKFHVPERITRWYAERTFRRLGRHILHPKLCGIGAKAANAREAAVESFVDANLMAGPWDTAISIIIQNPDLASSQAHTHAIVQNDHVAPSEELDPARPPGSSRTRFRVRAHPPEHGTRRHRDDRRVYVDRYERRSHLRKGRSDHVLRSDGTHHGMESGSQQLCHSFVP